MDRWKKATKKAFDVINDTRPSGPDAPGKQAKRFGSHIRNKVQQTTEVVSKAAMEAHDRALLLKHGSNLSDPPREDISSARVRVTVFSAADLRKEARGEVDSYCLVTVGQIGLPWFTKAANNQQCKLPVVLRRRHPRWNATCLLAVNSNENSELTVRVMDAHATRSDSVLGEARIPLQLEANGARTVRLLAGGFASLSLRWEVLAPGIPDSGAGKTNTGFDVGAFCVKDANEWNVKLREDAFNNARHFWSHYWDMEEAERSSSGAQLVERTVSTSTLDAPNSPAAFPGDMMEKMPNGFEFSPQVRRRPINRIGSCGGEAFCRGLDELLLQAPLSSIFAADEDIVVDFLSAISKKSSAIRPFGRSRIAVSLVDMLGGKKPAELLRERAEMLLLQLLRCSTGDELQELKQLIDTSGAGHDLLSLFAAISRKSLRTCLLEHFHEEAALVERRPVHVLSDIDMTVWVGAFGSGGPKFPSGAIPGAISLFGLLGGRITFLSARPPVWEARTRNALLNDIGIAEATVLKGTLQNVAMALINKKEAHKGMGEQKGNEFNRFADLHPDAKFVFFGDSGEGDVDFARNFMKGFANSSRTPPDRAAFIHDVVEADGVRPKTDETSREMLRQKGVYVFDTYAGAAKVLFDLGFLDKVGLRRALQFCCEEFQKIPPGSYDMPCIYATREAELKRDGHCITRFLEKKNSHEAVSDFLETSVEVLPPDFGSRSSSGPREERRKRSKSVDSSSRAQVVHEIGRALSQAIEADNDADEWQTDVGVVVQDQFPDFTENKTRNVPAADQAPDVPELVLDPL